MENKFSSNGDKSFFIESDLACERRRADVSLPGVEFTCEKAGAFSWERIKISSDEGAQCIGRPIGNYNTLTIEKLTELDEEDIEDASNEIAKELCIMVDRLGIKPDRLLIACLGNRELTPDSIGPRTAEKINATMHVRNYDRTLFYDLEYSEIAVCSPGVMAKTGMEATDIISAVCDRIEPDAVIAVDSLASRSPSRLGNTVQISDTGIIPGSGIGNCRHPLNIKTLGTPVIAIGVPTVINTKLLPGEHDSKSNGTSNFKNEMFVSPREIDTIAEISSKIIAGGINQAFGIFQ